jgi:2-dehydro-3-deoxygluconokinase
VYPELVTIGETMVVFEPMAEGPLRYVGHFKKGYGGAESNVAIGLTRLGHSAGWISRVGNDELGKFIISSIRGEGVDTSRVTLDNKYPTGIYIKERLTEGTAQVHYYRKGSAASVLKSEHLDWDYISKAKIIHLTGITPFLSDECANMIDSIISFAKTNNIFLSFDPNLRMKLMSGKTGAKEKIIALAKQSDIFMPGLDEAEYLLGTRNYGEIAEYFHNAGTDNIVIKNGKIGSFYSTRGGDSGFLPSYEVSRVIDPIGAGDGFAAGVLAGVLEHKSLQYSVDLGSRVGARVVTIRGDIEGLPVREEIESLGKTITDVLR